jgi:hypothetical protein
MFCFWLCFVPFLQTVQDRLRFRDHPVFRVSVVGGPAQVRNAGVSQTVLVLVVVIVLVLDFLGIEQTCSVEALIEHERENDDEND